ncbi:MAG TPA: NAD(P)/FAD-dependent oxidoreductase [Candidatus Binatia bacterium]|jgi:flavin-dependent dehydrogenase
MMRCDVLVVGGGPAGSTCARALTRAGIDVIVADKAKFPRDKVCAGWITPAVVHELELDLGEYARGRTLDAVHGFRIGRIGNRIHEHRYVRPMSYGIRRCELDHFLLERSGARLVQGVKVDAIERRAGRWKVGGIEADVLVGAGGHFCPVARATGSMSDAAVIAAEEAEFVFDEAASGGCAVEGGVPELYFTQDLTGYGWAFRKGPMLNIGLGVRSGAGAGGAGLRRRIEDFLAWLVREGRIGRVPEARMKGHAYVLEPDSRRTRFGGGFVLIGDAAGLACDRSGEGIRTAVESALMAAHTIHDALGRGEVGADALASYGTALARRFGAAADPSRLLPEKLRRNIAATLMTSGWFSRRILLERWFLHAHDDALPVWPPPAVASAVLEHSRAA